MTPPPAGSLRPGLPQGVGDRAASLVAPAATVSQSRSSETATAPCLLVAALCTLSPGAAHPQGKDSLDAGTLERLTLSWHDDVQLRPGQSYQFAAGTLKCCVWLKPVKAHVSWSITPTSGARIDHRTGSFTVDSSTPAGSVFTVTASVEDGRRVLSTRVHVYTLASNPLVGAWREESELPCGTDEPRAPADRIGELSFRADGRFTVTWHPFEIYHDYGGGYTYDVETGTLHLAVEGGNYVPRDVRGTGTFIVEGDKRLTLRDIWLGSRPKGTAPDSVCQMVFTRR